MGLSPSPPEPPPLYVRLSKTDIRWHAPEERRAWEPGTRFPIPHRVPLAACQPVPLPSGVADKEPCRDPVSRPRHAKKSPQISGRFLDEASGLAIVAASLIAREEEKCHGAIPTKYVPPCRSPSARWDPPSSCDGPNARSTRPFTHRTGHAPGTPPSYEHGTAPRSRTPAGTKSPLVTVYRTLQRSRTVKRCGHPSCGRVSRPVHHPHGPTPKDAP